MLPPSRPGFNATPSRKKWLVLLTLSVAANAVFVVVFFHRPAATDETAHIARFSGKEETLSAKRPRKPPEPKTVVTLHLTSEMDPRLAAAPKFRAAGDLPPGPEATQPEQSFQLDNLPDEKRKELQSIVSDYGELSEEIYARSNGLIAVEDREKLALLEKEKNADLAEVLTPPEFEAYQVRANDIARLHRR